MSAAELVAPVPAAGDRIPWQRVPQGWIEFAAFDSDDIADRWWHEYLARGPELDEATRSGMTAAFRAGREAFRSGPFAFAGLMVAPAENPTVIFTGTAIVSDESSRPMRARMVAAMSSLVRMNDDDRTEEFTSLDGRHGSATLGTAQAVDGSRVGVIFGQIPLPDATGQVFVLTVCADPNRLEEVAIYPALALDSTVLIEPGAEPGPYLTPTPQPDGDA